MKVLVVTTWWPHPADPTDGIFHEFDVELLARDHEVTVLHLANPKFLHLSEQSERSVYSWGNLIRQPYRTTSMQLTIKAMRAIRSLSKEHDVLHSMAFPSLPIVSKSRVSIPWIHTEHWTGLLYGTLPFRARILLRLTLKEFSKPTEVVAVGSDLASRIKEYRTLRTSIIPNRVFQIEKSTAVARNNVVRPSKVHLVSIGTLSAHKGILVAISTVSKLRQRGIDATLSWAGTGGGLEQDARELIQDLNLQGHVNLLGYVPQKGISEFLVQGQIFFLPTKYETFGIAIAEALGHGLPVVTGGEGEHTRFLPAKGSRLVKQRSPDAFADAIQDIMNDSKRWSSNQIRQYARDKFSESVRRERYRAIYERAIESSAR